MKTIRSSILCFVVLLLAAPLLRGQDLSKYRHFTFGMSLTRVLERTDQKMADVKDIHGRPALIQELTWWPPNIPGTSFRSDTVEQILFSFYNAELYKISATYDRTSTEGLTAEDMVKSISAKYGPPTNIALEVNSATNEQYEVRQKLVASWEDSQYSFRLVRSSFSGGFELVIYSKRLNAEAEVALAEAVELEKQEEPQREAERQKKDADDLEVTRQKNQKSFRP
ncbi:MAG: hypothetical protein WA715_13870 [Candidatus Acidiferrum sp.]